MLPVMLTNVDVFGRMSRKGQEKIDFSRQTQHYAFGEMSLRELISRRISIAAVAHSDCECNSTPNAVSQNAHVSYLFLTMQDCERNRIAYTVAFDSQRALR